MKIGVVGIGYVGLTTALGFASKGHEVVAYDINQTKVSMLRGSRVPFYEPGMDDLIKDVTRSGHFEAVYSVDKLCDCEVIFLAAGTPSSAQGDLNTHALKEAFFNIVQSGNFTTKSVRIVVKSTVQPRFTRELNESLWWEPERDKIKILFNPEFLREGSALEDFHSPERVVIGTHDGEPDPLMTSLWATVTDAPVITTTYESAELAKMAANAMLASRLTVLNEITRLAKYMDADMRDVLKVMSSDSRIGSSYLTPSFGWGGSCFPKDLTAIGRMYNHLSGAGVGMTTKVVPEMVKQNSNMISLWASDIYQTIIRMFVERNIPHGSDITIAVLGLSFKANTDDARDSPAIKMMEYLYWMDFDIRFKVYDPIGAQIDQRSVLNTNLSYHDDVCTCAMDADAILVLTPWESFKNIDPLILSLAVRTPFLFDGHGIMNADEFKNRGFEVLSIV